MGFVKFYARYIIYWLEKPLFSIYGAAHVLGPHRRFDKDLWSSFSASGQKHSLWEHVMKNGNHLDKQHGSWGLWNLVLINHGGNKLIFLPSGSSKHMLLFGIRCYWDFPRSQETVRKQTLSPIYRGSTGYHPVANHSPNPRMLHILTISVNGMTWTKPWIDGSVPKVFSIGEAFP